MHQCINYKNSLLDKHVIFISNRRKNTLIYFIYNIYMFVLCYNKNKESPTQNKRFIYFFHIGPIVKE